MKIHAPIAKAKISRLATRAVSAVLAKGCAEMITDLTTKELEVEAHRQFGIERLFAWLEGFSYAARVIKNEKISIAHAG